MYHHHIQFYVSQVAVVSNFMCIHYTEKDLERYIFVV